jgi:predicted transcriptional regulator
MKGGFDILSPLMRTSGAICCLEVEIVLKKIACFLFVAGATVILYGNIPAKHIIGCEKQGVPESVCVAAEWDSEKVDLLPAWNPDVRKLIVAQKSVFAAGEDSFKL